MNTISIAINAKLEKKIMQIAAKSGRSFDECVTLALQGYADEYEDVYKTDLCSVDNLERSFFLSIGE